MIQDTSLEAYFNKVLPTLNKRQAEILQRLMPEYNFNWTNMEIARKLGWSINRVTPRILELRKLGILEQSTRRKCYVTGNMAYAWEISSI